MYLKAIQMKGFKSFPGKTRLDFGSGVSVIVGPNGSGKSNIADAIVWALGEQSAAAVRGGQMQDLLFGGADGVPSASAAEVELVFDNADGTLDSDFSELSIARRLGRDGEGEYRINGARCRLVDMIEVLADTGLGKEMHSVLSQGKVDEVVASKPKDRRLLVEEAAGLGKHRKRRHRAQLKLAKTRDNLDRVLDVEREARSRLKPLKRQAAGADPPAALERPPTARRAPPAADHLLRAENELEAATTLATRARERRGEIEEQLAEVARLREAAEQKIAAEAARRERATESLFSVRSACERLENARERTADRAARLSGELERAQGELGQLELDLQPEVDRSRIEGLQRELAEIEHQGRAELEAEQAGMRAQLETARGELAGFENRAGALREAAVQAEQAAASARGALAEARQAQAGAHRERARLEGELGAVEQFLRETAGEAGADALAQQLAVEPGYEMAVTAVLGRRLRAAVVGDLVAGEGFLDALGEDGGSALLSVGGEASTAPATAVSDQAPPGGVPLAGKLSPSAKVAPVVKRLLAGVWLVDSLASLPSGFHGVAVTSAGRVFFGATGELRQAPAGGEQRTLSERNRRAVLAGQLAAANAAEEQARAALEAAEAALRDAEQSRDQAHDEARLARIARDELSGSVQGRAGAIERRIEAGLAEGPTAVRRAAIEAELRSERAHAEGLERAAGLQRRRRAELERKLQNMRAALPAAEALGAAFAAAATAGNERIAVLAAALDGDRAAGERLAQELREHASSEAPLQSVLREQGEQVTTAEVRAQRARDLHAEATGEVGELAAALGREVAPATQLLDDARSEEINASLTRIARRRELLGPINPLARDEFAEALAHVEELETGRGDLETALAELNDLIKQIDRTIRTSFEQTFSSTSAHFQELVGRLFPGGEGRLNLVREERPNPAPLLATDDGAEARAAADAAEQEMPEDPDTLIDAEIEYGVEIEVRLPGSKSGRRLSLLSGGERSLVALAFLFSVFLTRPCPFYVFDEAEAALDDINIDRLVGLLREHSDDSQFIVITHQKRTIAAADCLYGVSMGADGISKVITRRMNVDGRPATDDQPELAVA